MDRPCNGLAARWIAAFAVAGASACIGQSLPTLTEQEFGEGGTGALEVIAVTRGQNFDPDGYLVSIDEGLSETVPANGSVRFEELRSGATPVMIADVAPNCALSGPNRQTATVQANSTATISFIVDCV